MRTSLDKYADKLLKVAQGKKAADKFLVRYNEKVETALQDDLSGKFWEVVSKVFSFP